MNFLSDLKTYASKVGVPVEVTLADDLTPIPVRSEFIFISSLEPITLNANPVFLNEENGKIVTIFNQGLHTITFVQSVGNQLKLVVPVPLAPGQCIAFIYKSGFWLFLYSNKLIDFSVAPPEIFVPVESADINLVAYESLQANDLVNIFEENNQTYCRKASHLHGFDRQADGFVKLPVSNGNTAAITTKDGSVLTFPDSSLLVNENYYLGVDGKLTLNPPAEDSPENVDKLIQFIGRPLTKSLLSFKPSIVAVNKIGDN